MDNRVRVGIYTRVSTESQYEDGRSLEWQEFELQKYAKKNNLDIIDIYVERGISGDELSTRPQINRLLNDIKSKHINNLLIFKIDRLGRKTEVCSTIAKIIKKSNCLITTLTNGTLDLRNGFNKFEYNMFSALSELEVDNLSERVINGKKQRARDGLYINSNSVFGYNKYHDKNTGELLLEVNEFESVIIKRIYKLYLDGISMNKISKILNEEKVSCKRGGKWHQSTILQILKNKLYIGKVIYNGNLKEEYIEVEGKHKLIIDEVTFNSVQQLISIKEKFKAKKFPNEYSYFSSIISCPFCGSKFKAKQTKAKDKNSIRYYCGKKECCLKGLSHNELLKLFEKNLENVKLNYDRKTIESLLENPDYIKTNNSLECLLRKRNEIDEQFISGNLSIDIFRRSIANLENKINTINSIKLQLEENKISLDEKAELFVREMIFNISKSFLMLSDIDKQNFVNLFVDKIEIEFDDNNLNIKNLIWNNKSQCL